jgi:hypothetical protein
MNIRAIVLFLVLLAFWLLLSARLDPVFLGMGVGSAALVAWLTNPLVTKILGPELGPAALLRRAWYYVVYLVWLVGRIVPAGCRSPTTCCIRGCRSSRGCCASAPGCTPPWPARCWPTPSRSSPGR